MPASTALSRRILPGKIIHQSVENVIAERLTRTAGHAPPGLFFMGPDISPLPRSFAE